MKRWAASLLLLLAAIAGTQACPFAGMMQGTGDLEAAGRKLLQTCNIGQLDQVRTRRQLAASNWPLGANVGRGTQQAALPRRRSRRCQPPRAIPIQHACISAVPPRLPAGQRGLPARWAPFPDGR